MRKIFSVEFYKKLIKAHPEMLPALLVLPISSVAAVIVWLSLKLWYKRKA